MPTFNLPIKKSSTKKESNIKNIKKANLGMFLEDMINETNEYYRNADIAVIHKKPTPIQIVKVSYPNREHALITEAYYKTPSTTDYNGVYDGYYIDFEAKETDSLTSFPLKNVSLHQVLHLKQIIAHKGIGFLIIFFKKKNEAYILELDDFLLYWDNKKEGRKSIPYEFINEKGHQIPISFKPRIDYLSVVKDVFIKKIKAVEI